MIKIIQNKSVLDYEIEENSVILTSSNIYKYKEKYLNEDILITNKVSFYNKYVNKRLVSKEEKILIMSRAFFEIKDKLKFYNLIDDISFSNLLINNYSFYMENDIKENDKKCDLKLIYDNYNSILEENNLIDEYMLYDLFLDNIDDVKYDNIYFENINKLSKYDIKIINKLKEYKNIYLYANTINNDSLIFDLNKIDKVEYEETEKNDVNKLYKIGESNLFEDINIIACNDIYEEVKYILLDIKKKINNGLKYKDILVISPDINRYENYFETMFDIPYHKKEINGFLTKSFIDILSKILNGDFSCKTFINLLKLDLFDINKVDIDYLDNYIYIWNLENNNFYETFNYNPNGKKEFSDNDRKLLDKLNNLREHVISSFLYLLENTKDEDDVKEILKYLYMFIDENEISDKLYKQDEKGYNNLVNYMEYIYEYIKKANISEVLNYLSLMLNNINKNIYNQDEIKILSLDNYEKDDYKMVYFIGLTEKDIPSKFSFSNLFSNKDITYDTLFDLLTRKTSYDNNLVSNVLLNKNVIITYHKLTDAPSKVEISPLLLKFKNKPNSFKYIINKEENINLNKKIDKKLIDKLYEKELNLSPSSLEVFAKCKYSYFLSYSLKLKIKEKLLFDNREVGTFIHFILENAMKDNINKDDIKENVDKYVNTYLESNNYNFNSIDLYIIDELKKSTYILVEILLEELSNTKLKPEKEELKIKDIPLVIKLDDGILKVSGIVDRLDSYIENDSYYYRIIDYKTGNKKFRLDDLLIGLNMQMLIYLIAIKESIKDKIAIPTGFLYYPALIHYNKENINIDVDSAIENLKNSIKANGIVNKESISLYDEDNIGKYLDVTTRGKLNEEKVFSKDELEIVFKKVKDVLRKEANSILDGDISINPVIDSKNDACKYCMYNAICKFDINTNKPRRYKSLKNKEALKSIEEGE